MLVSSNVLASRSGVGWGQQAMSPTRIAAAMMIVQLWPQLGRARPLSQQAAFLGHPG